MINERYANQFCRDDISKIENYNKAIADPTQTWHCHHRLELTLDGDFALSVADLKMHDMYYHRPYYELIFLTKSEHSRIHRKGRPSYMKGKPSPMKGRHLSAETKRKLSEAMKGRTITEEHIRKIVKANTGKQHYDETKRKISEAHKGKKLSSEHRSHLSESHKGKYQLEESRKKRSESMKEYWRRRKADSKK